MTPAVAGLLGAAIAALGAYITASRRLSGRVAQSEASSLWEESASIRHDYREQINADRERISRLEDRVGKAEARNTELGRENVELARQLAAAEQTIAELRADLAHAREEVVECKRENEALRTTIRRMTAEP
jgi:chromosome segregation ATPase